MKITNRDILRLAIPSILANITIPLVGLVDTAIVGHISDASAIGGIAIGTMLFDLLYWNFGFLRVGTSGMTAQAFGRGDHAACARLLIQSLGIAALGTVVIWLLQWFFVTGVLAIVPCSAAVSSFARRYFFIRIWAAPATLSLMAFKGWFIGMQDTRSPMAVDIVVNVVNMLASYLLAVHTSLGAIGVAWGTLLAQFTGLLLAVVLMLCQYRSTMQSVPWLATLRDLPAMRSLVVLNSNLLVRSLCFMVVYVGYTMIASHYGDTELAVSSILMKLFMLFSFFVDGFAYAAEALVGRAIGASEIEPLLPRKQKMSPLHQLVNLLFGWGMVVGILFTIIYALWGDLCILLMTDDASVLSAADPYMLWLVLMPVVSTMAFVWDGIYVGATEGPKIRNAMIWAAVAFACVYLVCFRWLGTQALYVAYFAHLAARVIYLTVNKSVVYDKEISQPSMASAQE